VRRGLLGVLTATTLGFPVHAIGDPADQACCKRQVILFVDENASYEQIKWWGWPVTPGGEIGVGLLTAADDREISGLHAYEAIGAGGGQKGAMRAAIERAGLRAALVTGTRLTPREKAALLGPGDLVQGNEIQGNENVLRTSSLIITGQFGPIPDTINALGPGPVEEFLFVGVVPVRSASMSASADEVSPVVVARGSPNEFDPREGTFCAPVSNCASGLLSNTTRRAGIVSNVDVAPTILDFLGIPIPEEMTGSPIRIEGEPPTRLHQRYLQYQRIHTPVGVIALAVALLGLFASVGFLLARRMTSPSVAKALGILALVSVALPVVMLPASLLPHVTYPFVLPTLFVGAALLTVLALQWRRDDPTAPVAVIAGLGMGVVILDGVLGWPAMLMPLLGDSALEGVRFYGMGNAYAGVYMAGAILLAAGIPPVAGMGLLLATGLLAGLPNFGAELGTSFTLFVAAGLWYVLRVRQRFGAREVAGAAAIALLGVAAVLLVHRFSEVPTHVTRVVEEAERSGPAEFLTVFARRLSLNVRNTSATPFAWLILGVLPVWLVVAWKRLRPFGEALRKDPAWRDAAVVLALSAIIGFLVNDSIGVTGLGFTFLSAALISPALRERWTSRA
jgi:hypothetical protein